MPDQPQFDRTAVVVPQELRSIEGTLSEQAAFLAPLSDSLVARWSELYLETFGRSAFFSSQRVEKTFKELTQLFIVCLKERCLEIYLENLKEKGRLLSRMGVPFEEVIVSLHLFEEVCLEQFLEVYPNRSKLPRLILAMEELHGQGLATLATSYFETVKKEMQRLTDGLREENDVLRGELSQTKQSFFMHTTKELTSMQLLLSGINHKLRSRVYQLSRIQKMSDALENEADVPQLLKIASDQLLALCPPNSDAYFAFFDEDRKKVNLYGQESRQSPRCDIVKTFYFSELSGAFQDVLYDETKKFAHFKGYSEIAKPLLELVTIKNQREFLLTPLRRFGEVTGFVLLSVHEDDFFTKANYKLYQRLGQTVSKAVTAALLFTRAKKQDEFASLLNELNKSEFLTKPLESVLDFYLGSFIDLLGAERSSVMLYDAASRELKVCAAKGYKVYPISGVPIKWGEGIAGLALKESKIFAVTKMKEAQHFNNPFTQALKRKEAPETRVKSLLVLPFFQGREPLGVVNISTINYHKNFDQPDIDMARELANRMAGVIKNL